jgi:hypothetical protein
VGHEEAGARVKRTSASVALLVAILALAGAAGAERLGPAPPAPVTAPTARSASWYCPHGGGQGWKGTLALANPGETPVQARITSLSGEAPDRPEVVSVPPGREVLRPLVAEGRASATAVETFGGYLAAGWLIRSADAPTGLGAEPCLPTAGTSWTSAELSSKEGDEGFLIVMNPFAAQAVVELAVFSPDLPPLRDPEWTDVRIGPGRSVAFDVAASVPGATALTVTVEVHTGRVAVGSLSTTAAGGVRSAVATPTQTSRRYLPVVGGTGESQLILGVTDEAPVLFDAVMRSRGAPQPAGGLIAVRQGGLSTGTYPLVSEGPSLVELTTRDDHPVAATLRASGQAADGAVTAGTTDTSPAWIVTPTSVEEPWFPGLVVANPGSSDVTVHVRSLPSGDGVPVVEASFHVAAGRVGSPPKHFLAADPRGAVLVEATGPVVALGGSSSSGLRGIAWFALAMGSPVPEWVLGAGGT